MPRESLKNLRRIAASNPGNNYDEKPGNPSERNYMKIYICLPPSQFKSMVSKNTVWNMDGFYLIVLSERLSNNIRVANTYQSRERAVKASRHVMNVNYSHAIESCVCFLLLT